MLTATDRSTAPVRRVRILTAGGTIAMMGEGGATPELDAEALVASVPGLQVFPDLEAITVLNKPSAHLTLDDQLRICRAARDAARRGHRRRRHPRHRRRWRRPRCSATSCTTPTRRSSSPARSVRPAPPAPTARPTSSTPSASRPARLPPGWASWSSSAARSTTRAARARPTRRRWSRSPRPQTGPLGRVTEGHPTIWSRIPRNPPLDPPSLEQARAHRAVRRPVTTARSRAPRWAPSPTASSSARSAPAT